MNKHKHIYIATPFDVVDGDVIVDVDGTKSHEHEDGNVPHVHPGWIIDFVELYEHDDLTYEMDVVHIRAK